MFSSIDTVSKRMPCFFISTNRKIRIVAQKARLNSLAFSRLSIPLNAKKILAPYMSMDRVIRLFQLRREEKLLKTLAKYGTNKSKIQEIKSEFADRKPEQGEDYYYYNGPLDDKTRPFCVLMLKIDKVFSSFEIEKITSELGYDVLKYRGSYNCRHQWVRFRGKRIYTPKPTIREIRKLINNGIES